MNTERSAPLGGGVPQTQRWLPAGCFEALVDDLRAVLGLAAGRKAKPSVAIIDSRTLCSTPESRERARYDGGKRKKARRSTLRSTR